MKIKLLILIGIIFCMSGCDINYNLEIVDDKYTENVSVIETDSSNWDKGPSLPSKDLLDVYMKKPIPLSSNDPLKPESDEPIEGIAYYDKKDLSNENQIGINLSGEFDKEKYNSSRLVAYAYNRFLIGTVNGNIVLSTGEKAKIFEQYKLLNKLTIKIKTNHVVVKNNADEVDGQTYIWNVTQDNYKNKPIYLEMSKEKKVSNYDNVIGKTIMKVVLIVGIVILVIGLIFL